mmetsp:Transcript_16010/g.34656  ORF Transcript_16010/g.34656 Transcript_16010/m.34656 type:complete len:295 (+) Transcript_16010:232-1116(+)
MDIVKNEGGDWSLVDEHGNRYGGDRGVVGERSERDGGDKVGNEAGRKRAGVSKGVSGLRAKNGEQMFGKLVEEMRTMAEGKTAENHLSLCSASCGTASRTELHNAQSGVDVSAARSELRPNLSKRSGGNGAKERRKKADYEWALASLKTKESTPSGPTITTLHEGGVRVESGDMDEYVRVRFVWRNLARSVFLAASFSEWSMLHELTPVRSVPLIFAEGEQQQQHHSRTSSPMMITERVLHSYWELVLDLLPGTYHYVFFVDGRWKHDTSALVVKDARGDKVNRINVKHVPVQL